MAFQGLTIAIESANASAIVASANMSNPLAALIDEMICRQSARSLVVNSDEVGREAGELPIDQYVGVAESVHPRESLRIVAGRGDDQGIELARNKLLYLSRF